MTLRKPHRKTPKKGSRPWLARRGGRPIGHRPRPSGGFSILEVLTALAIFSVAIVGIAQGITMQIRTEGVAENVTRAAMLADNTMQSLRISGELTVGEESSQFEGEDSAFTWQYAIEDTETPGLFKVKVSIFWLDGLAERSYVIETLMADR